MNKALSKFTCPAGIHTYYCRTNWAASNPASAAPGKTVCDCFPDRRTTVPGPGQSWQSIPLLAYGVTIVSVHEKRQKTSRKKGEREGGMEGGRQTGATRGWGCAEMHRVLASTCLSGILDRPRQAVSTSLTPTSRPMRFQDRLRLEKEIPPPVCKHYPWTCLKGRKTTTRAYPAQLPIIQDGLVSFHSFHSLSLGRVGPGDGL